MPAKRVQIVVDENFLKDIDKAASKLQLSRSAFMSMCCAYTMLMPSGILKVKDKQRLREHFENYANSVIFAEKQGKE